MFSPTELLHLVFANDDDLYYGENLLKLDLNQYLWLKLHESGYQSVYYLHKDKEGFQVRTYGDLRAELYEPSWFLHLFKTEAQNFGEWMLSQLRGKSTQRAAFVCPMDTFCAIAGEEPWSDVLRKLARADKRTGILVLTAPVEVEKTRELLLGSSVFAALRDPAIYNLRTGTLCPIYRALAVGKPSGVVYLNGYTQERLRALLLHVMMDGENLFADDRKLDRMAEYLTQYLNNAWLQRARPLFGECKYNEYPKYCELYQRLRERTVWRRLEDAAEAAAQQGGLEAYLSAIGCRYRAPCDVPVFPMREGHTAAGRCVSLWPPERVDRAAKDGKESAFQIAREIDQILLAPRNRSDSGKITAEMEGFRNLLDSALSNEDYETYRLILKAIRFCAQRLQTPADSEEEKSVLMLDDSLRALIKSSEDYFNAARRLELYRYQGTSRQLAGAQFQQLRAMTDAARRRLNRLEELVMGAIVKIDLTASAKEVTELASSLQNQLTQFWSEPQDEAEALQEPEELPEGGQPPEPVRQQWDEELEIVLGQEVFSAKPPES